MISDKEKTQENNAPDEQAQRPAAPPESEAGESAKETFPPEAAEETAEGEKTPQPHPDPPGPQGPPDQSDDESETARIAEEAAEEGPLEGPLPETEDEMAELMPPEQAPPGEQGEQTEMVKPELSLPESGAEIEETPEEAETEQPSEEAFEEREPSEEESEEVEEEVALPEEEPEEEEEEEVAEKKPRPSRIQKVTGLPTEEEAEKRWYVIHAHSGHENKVKQSLESRVKQEHLEELVAQIIVPTEEVAEVKGGKKRITSRKIFPGYVLVEMKLTHKTWYLIRTTAGVTGFIGSGKWPTPLEPEEVEAIFEQMRGEQKKPKPKMIFEKDEKVKIIEGPFTNFMGYVDEVNPERGKLKVMVEIFERLTPVELEFWQVEKV
jgi:transcriptional antiterminator NusG